MGEARRGFLKSLAAAPFVSGALLDARAEAVAPQAAAEPAEADPAADALAELVRHRYGAHLAPGDLEDVRKVIRLNLQAARRLREKLALANSDEPVTVFEALPGDGAAPQAR